MNFVASFKIFQKLKYFHSFNNKNNTQTDL